MRNISRLVRHKRPAQYLLRMLSSLLVFCLLAGCSTLTEETSESEILLDYGLHAGGRVLLTESYSIAPGTKESPDDDPMNHATPKPTPPPPDKLIALTFDDGPVGETKAFVETLNAIDVDCTFFMQGYLIEIYPETVRTMVKGGHQIASHSYNHPNLTTCSKSESHAQIMDTEALLNGIDGKNGHYIRCPYGESGDYVKSIAPGPLIYWSVDTLDWSSLQADAVCEELVNSAYDGAIVLMHDVHDSTREGVLKAIPLLQQDGYEFVTVEELLKRREVEIQNGVTYYDAKDNGTTLPDGSVSLTFGSFSANKQPQT